MGTEITVVVPYHNERETIEYTLEQVGAQSFPAVAAIFVNSSSTDDTSLVVDRWIDRNQQRFSTKFRNVFEDTHNPGSSKNVGVRQAETEWVAFMDCGQSFEKSWLDKQINYAIETDSEIVSGGVSLVGENWIDRCAVAQTYGYKRFTPCVPSTLVKKSIFKKTGFFLEGRRAGYDLAWAIKVKSLGLKRAINRGVEIRYIGINYSSNFTHLLKKTNLYQLHSVGLEDYLMPYAYVAFPLLILTLIIFAPQVALGLGALYVLARFFLVPFLKAPLMLKEHPFEFLLGAGLVGVCIDFARMSGVLQGIFRYSFRNSVLR